MSRRNILTIMETTTSFAPLAGRLAAHAVDLRPVEGSRDNLAKFMALVLCALLDMLVLVCEMLDARAVVATRTVIAAVPRDGRAPCIASPRAGHLRLPRTMRMVSPIVGTVARVVAPRLAVASSETAVATIAGPWLASDRPRFATVVPLRKPAFSIESTHALFVTITK